MIALRTGADRGDTAAAQLFQTLDVGLAGGRQLVEGVAVGDVFIPAGMVS